MTPSQALAGVVVDELVRLGVRDVVLAPGSRSAPLAYALATAHDTGRLRLHVRTDERAAAFLALGLGKANGLPAAVVTTSGTAVANLLPAALEAHEAAAPLLLLTADRPPELRGTRANQTTEQPAMFAAVARWQHDLGTPSRGHIDAAEAVTWRTVMDRAVAAATGALGGVPGPAHVNIPLRDPLAPARNHALVDRAAGADGAADGSSRQVPGDEPLSGVYAGRADGAPWTRVGGALSETPKTLVVVGDATPGLLVAASDYAQRHGYPLIGEPWGPPLPERVPLGSLLAEAGLSDDLLPEHVLVVGRLTLTRPLAGVLRTPGARIELVTADPRWPDAGHRVDLVTTPEALDVSPVSVSVSASGGGHYAAAWRARAHRAIAAVDDALARGWPSGPAVGVTLLRSLPTGARLFVGSSSSARDVDLARRDESVTVVGSRGLAGIDGNLSTAAGLALASPDVPTYALLGDLTLLHDANALVIGPGESVPPLTVVVLDDDGGAIFGTLEYGEPDRIENAAARATFERVFGTPTGTDIEALARAHGVNYRRCENAEQLADAVSTPPVGLTLVHLRLDRHARRAEHAALVEAVRAALTEP